MRQSQITRLAESRRPSNRRWWPYLLMSLIALAIPACGSKGTSKTSKQPTKQASKKATQTDAPRTTVNSDTMFSDPNTGKTIRKRVPVMHSVTDFQLRDQSGEQFNRAELDGCIWVANLMFTRCTETCPQQTAQMAKLQQRLSSFEKWDIIRLISITVDPEHDTPEVLAEYGQRAGADDQHWKFLTGDVDVVGKLSREGFKLPLPEGSSAAAASAHSPRFVLVDTGQRVRGVYDALNDAGLSELIGDAKVLAYESKEGDDVTHIAFPEEILDPPWLDARMTEQLNQASSIEAFHEFQFRDMVESSGITFRNRVTADGARDWKPNHYDHGNGMSVADVDGDSLLDIYFVNQVGANQLWRNLGGGRFEDITDSAGVALADRISVTASFADADNDGDADLFVTTVRHGNAFFENDGKGRFKDITTDAGLEYQGHSSGAVFFDYNRDGKLDLFVTNVGRYTTDDIGYNGDAEKKEFPYYVGQKDAFGGHLRPSKTERSILYRNEGGNRFADVTDETGLIDESWSGDASPIDFNDDGWPDLYAVNMQGNDELYENLDGKRFKRRSREIFPVTPWGAMGIKVFDFNNDGMMDVYICDMHSDMWELGKDIKGADEKLKPARNVTPESYLRSDGHSVFGNALFQKFAKDEYRDVSDDTGAENFWPWGMSIGDLNADGFDDVFLASSMNFPFRYHVNSVLLNEAGQRFRDSEFILGVEPRRGRRTAIPWFELDSRSPRDKDHKYCQGIDGKVVAWGAIGTRSSAIFDLDEDGDLDIVTNDFNSEPMVLISNLAEKQPGLSYLKVNLVGKKSNRDGLGATVRIIGGDMSQVKVHDGVSGYLSHSRMPLYFGLSNVSKVDQIEVTWPSGTVQKLVGPIECNRVLDIVEE